MEARLVAVRLVEQGRVDRLQRLVRLKQQVIAARGDCCLFAYVRR